MQLLIENYEDGDVIFLEKIIAKTKNEDKIHNLIFDYLKILENHLTPKCQRIFEYFYEKMNCGIHRYDTVILLYDNKILSNNIIEELEYNSDDIRKFFHEVIQK